GAPRNADDSGSAEPGQGRRGRGAIRVDDPPVGRRRPRGPRAAAQGGSDAVANGVYRPAARLTVAAFQLLEEPARGVRVAIVRTHLLEVPNRIATQPGISVEDAEEQVRLRMLPF